MGEKKSKLDWAAIIIQIIILGFATIAAIFSYFAANTANNLTKRSLEILEKQSNYPLQVIPYPIYAIILGDYENGSSEPVLANGFLNTTFIIISPDVVRLTIENMNIIKINDENSSVVPNFDPPVLQNFDQAKFDQWSINFSTNSNLRYSTFPSPDNNFTYYTSHEGISSIAVSLPIKASFYLNPNHAFKLSTDNNETVVQLGTVTVTSRVFNVQTKQITPVTFSTILYAQVKIL